MEKGTVHRYRSCTRSAVIALEGFGAFLFCLSVHCYFCYCCFLVLWVEPLKRGSGGLQCDSVSRISLHLFDFGFWFKISISKVQNEEGIITELYILGKCSETNK